MKKISIIMPVYNKKNYVERSIESIVKQTFQDFEFLIVDDGSTDGSAEICDKWAEKDQRIQVLHIKNGGVSNARNIAMDIATADYITFMDADDYVGKKYLENLYNCIVQEQVDLVISGYTKIWEKTKVEEQFKMPIIGKYSIEEIMPYFAKWQCEMGIFGYCWAKIFSRSIAAGIKFDTRIKLAEDFDFYLKLYKKVDTIYFDEHTDYFYVQEAENSTSIISDNEIDYVVQLEINMRYRKFLEEKNSYKGENKEIVEKKISDYFYFALFHCDMEKFDECFMYLYKLYCENQVLFKGNGFYAKYILWLFKNNKKESVRKSLLFYRYARKKVRGR